MSEAFALLPSVLALLRPSREPGASACIGQGTLGRHLADAVTVPNMRQTRRPERNVLHHSSYQQADCGVRGGGVRDQQQPCSPVRQLWPLLPAFPSRFCYCLVMELGLRNTRRDGWLVVLCMLCVLLA
ncbi:hypothetical protein CGRA01v4_13377 [Colletotrichum graminicola]|nr:hypothetical protein CGRA01v4_13377 [Colletotrichum graminicola]